MTVEQAMNLIVKYTGDLRISSNEHAAITQALEVINRELRKLPVIAPAKDPENE